jgi:preprotein translocase SecE subunit
MSDDQPVKKKRQVKNPETFRERVVKAAEEGDKPKKSRRVRQAAGKAAAPVTGPIRQGAKNAGKSKAFKPFKKPINIIGRILVPKYFRDSWKELRLVTWPTWKESQQLTLAVLIFAFIFGAIVAIVDYGLDKLFREILLK